MQTIKTIFKIMMIALLFVVLFWVFRAIGITIINNHFSQNIFFDFREIIIEFLSFVLALYLSIKSFYNEKPLKVTLIVLASFLMLLLISVVITKILLQNSLVEIDNKNSTRVEFTKAQCSYV